MLELLHSVYGDTIRIIGTLYGLLCLGITMPDGENQFALMSAVYKRSSLDPSTVDYVECHGTGTQAGDPQESRAVSRLMCEGRSNPLLVGSVKSNIGHTEGAAGMESESDGDCIADMGNLQQFVNMFLQIFVIGPRINCLWLCIMV